MLISPILHARRRFWYLAAVVDRRDSRAQPSALACETIQGVTLTMTRFALGVLLASAGLLTPRWSAATEADSGAGMPPPSTLHPFRTIAEDGSNLELGFAGQLRATMTNSGEHLDDDDRETEEVVELRRVRLLMRGGFFEDRLRFGLQLSLAPASPELMDLWADFRFTAPIRLRMGQFKIPLTRYRWQSFSHLLFADWPIAANQFGSERQLGLMLHNGQKDNTPWSYALGVFTGQNARASFAKGIADAYGERLESPSNFRTPGEPTSIHPEVVTRISHNSPDIDATSNSDEKGGGLRHLAGVSAAWDLDATQAKEFSERLAAEVLLKYEGVSLSLVGYAGMFRPEGKLNELGSVGATGELAWRFLPSLEVAGRYSRVDFTTHLRQSARDRADSIIAEADPAEQEDLTRQYAAAGAVESSQEVALALSWYLVGHSLKWQNDVAYLRCDSDSRPAEDIRFRSQVQVVF